MKPSDLDKELDIYYVDEDTGEEYTFTEYLDLTEDSIKTLLYDPRISILKIERPVNKQNYIYVRIKFDPSDGREPLNYVIYNNLFNKFTINRLVLNGEYYIAVSDRIWAKTDNLYDWIIETFNHEKQQVKFPEKDIADIIEILYEHDIILLDKTIKENRAKIYTDTKEYLVPARRNPTPYERTKAEVYSRGNKWEIENWESTHN